MMTTAPASLGGSGSGASYVETVVSKGGMPVLTEVRGVSIFVSILSVYKVLEENRFPTR
jgi:hypothetical protein